MPVHVERNVALVIKAVAFKTKASTVTVAQMFQVPFNVYILMFSKQLGIVTKYGGQDLLMMFTYYIFIAAFQFLMDAFTENLLEFAFGWKLREFATKANSNFVNRKRGWVLDLKLDELDPTRGPTVDVFKTSQIRLLNIYKMCFQEQYFFLSSMCTMGFVLMVYGMYIIIAALYETPSYWAFFDFPWGPIVVLSTWVMCSVVHLACVVGAKAIGLWKTNKDAADAPTDYKWTLQNKLTRDVNRPALTHWEASHVDEDTVAREQENILWKKLGKPDNFTDAFVDELEKQWETSHGKRDLLQQNTMKYLERVLLKALDRDAADDDEEVEEEGGDARSRLKKRLTLKKKRAREIKKLTRMESKAIRRGATPGEATAKKLEMEKEKAKTARPKGTKLRRGAAMAATKAVTKKEAGGGTGIVKLSAIPGHAVRHERNAGKARPSADQSDDSDENSDSDDSNSDGSDRTRAPNLSSLRVKKIGGLRLGLPRQVQEHDMAATARDWPVEFSDGLDYFAALGPDGGMSGGGQPPSQRHDSQDRSAGTSKPQLDFNF